MLSPNAAIEDSLLLRQNEAAITIQKHFRAHLSKKRFLKHAESVIEKHYDEDNDKHFYYNTLTSESAWQPPAVIEKLKQSSALLIRAQDSDSLAKDHEENPGSERQLALVESGRQSPDEESIPEITPMELWDVPATAAWFRSIDFPEYAENIFKYKVNGLLLGEMKGRDWSDLGIQNRLHLRRIQLEIERHKAECEQGEELRLEKIAAAEEAAFQARVAHERALLLQEVDDPSELTPEDLADKLNIFKEMIHHGDNENFPYIGDVVRLDFEVSLLDGTKIDSTKHKRKRPFEFVIGEGQVIKGFERAVAGMSLGERSKFTISAEYAYGEEGMIPNIPPGSKLVFDATLLAFWARPLWLKPLIQQPGLSEKPYEPDEGELVLQDDGEERGSNEG
mmetsp:Transcript_46555/g.80204  ORF Transcript_46555/g.80204 Transcript_46555/m.80204 type:complete len:393 (-) Transcript_46555:192-1370(-)